MPRRFEWGYETDTAMPQVLCSAHPQVVAADYLFELSQLPKLQEPGISSKRPWCAGSASCIAWPLHLLATPSCNRILPRLRARSVCPRLRDTGRISSDELRV